MPEFRAGARAAAERCADVLDATRGEDPGPAVAAALRQHGETGLDTLTATAVADLVRACAPLWECARAVDTADAARALGPALAAAGPVRLSAHGDTAWHLHVDVDDDRADWAEWFVGSSALALAILIAEDQRPPLAICSDDGCERPYVTGGRGRPRRFCSSTCATRTRVARYRAAD